MILRLTRDLGVNLAGVDVILRLKEQIDEYEALVEELKSNLEQANKENTKRSLVKRKDSFDLIFLNDKK